MNNHLDLSYSESDQDDISLRRESTSGGRESFRKFPVDASSNLSDRLLGKEDRKPTSENNSNNISPPSYHEHWKAVQERAKRQRDLKTSGDYDNVNDYSFSPEPMRETSVFNKNFADVGACQAEHSDSTTKTERVVKNLLKNGTKQVSLKLLC